MEIDHTLTGCEQSRRDQLLLQEELSEQNRDLRETRIKSLHEIEEWKRVQELRVDEFSRRRLIENQDTVIELTARIQELQNEVNCLNDSGDFLSMPSQYAVDHPTFPVNQRYFHHILIQEDCQAAIISRQIFGIRRVYLETFLQIHERLLRHFILENSILGFVT